MHQFFKEEANIYCKMFNRESQKSLTGLNVLDNFVKQIHNQANNSTEIHEIQRYIRMLSVISHILETFNANVETTVSSIDEHIFNELVASYPNTVCLRVKEWLPDLSQYQINDTFSGCVTHILDSDQKLCFVKDLTGNTSINFKDGLHSAFDGTPDYGHIFALEMNRKFFRAIRIDAEITNMVMRVRLIDIGETVSISPNTYKYNLVDDAKRVPPMAILCRIEKFNGKLVNSLNDIGKKVFGIKIKNICVNMLEVELVSESENGMEEANDTLQKTIIECLEMSNHENHQWPATRTPSTPATNSLISKPQQTPATNGLMSKSQTPTPNGQLLKPQTPVTNGPMSKPPTPTPMIFHNGRHNMHRAESPMLIDLQTSQETLANLARACSPLPPVPPRRPKSCTPSSGAPMRIPLNIVKRRNSSVSENAKPNFLNQNGNHSPPSPDELEPTKQNGAHPKVPRNYQNGNDYINIMNNNNIGSNQAIDPLPMPSSGNEIEVIPTHVANADLMYVQFCEFFDSFSDFQYIKLQTITPKQLGYIPKPNDLVLARYGDNQIYRARVEQVDQSNVIVFYVDYGDTQTVGVDSLFEWQSLCNTIPFQAVPCRLENVHIFPNTSANAIYDFIHQYLNKKCKAVVLENAQNALLVKLKNPYGRDIDLDIKNNLFDECIV